MASNCYVTVNPNMEMIVIPGELKRFISARFICPVELCCFPEDRSAIPGTHVHHYLCKQCLAEVNDRADALRVMMRATI